MVYLGFSEEDHDFAEKITESLYFDKIFNRKVMILLEEIESRDMAFMKSKGKILFKEVKRLEKIPSTQETTEDNPVDMIEFKAKDFMEVFKQNDDFVNRPTFKFCYKLIILTFTISDRIKNETLLRPLQNALSLLKSYGLTGVNLWENQSQYKLEKQLTSQSNEMLRFMARVVKKIEVNTPTSSHNTKERRNRIVYFLVRPQIFYLE